MFTKDLKVTLYQTAPKNSHAIPKIFRNYRAAVEKPEKSAIVKNQTEISAITKGKKMKKTAVMFLAALICGCVNIEYQGKTAQLRKGDAMIAVFTDSAKIKTPYTVLGQAIASGSYQEVSRDRMVDKLKDKAAECGADAILIVEQQVRFKEGNVAVNPAFMTAFDYDETEGNWKQLYEDVDRNFVNVNRNRTSTSAGSTNNFTRIIRAEFLRYNR